MNKLIGFLSAVLMAQLLLAGALTFSAPDLAAVRPDTPLIDLGERSVDRLLIEGSDGENTVLQKGPDRWFLPDHFGFPVEQGKARQLVADLEALEHGYPVATTAAALTRFKVTDEAFERRITLMGDGGTLETIYLGSSPGMRRVHARTGEDEVVYSVAFSAYRAPAEAEDWEDKEIVRFPREEIREIRVAGLTIGQNPKVAAARPEATAPRPAGGEAEDGEAPAPKPPVWVATDGLGEGERLNDEGVSKLTRLLAELRIARVLGLESKPEYGLDAPRLTLGYSRKAAGDEAMRTVEYALGKPESDTPESDTHFVLKSSHRPEYFRLHGYTAEPLVEAAVRDRLVAAAD